MMAYLVDINACRHEVIDVEPILDEYYRLIGCRCVDFPTREIDGHPYNIICDDEGFLKPNHVSAVSSEKDMFGRQEQLVGNLLLFGVDQDNHEHGNRSLTDDEVAQIEEHVMEVFGHPIMFYTR